MSIEAIKGLSEVESAGVAQRDSAIQAGRERLAEVQRAGRKLAQESQAAAEGEAKAMLAQAESNAAEATQTVLAQAAADCAAMQAEARTKLDGAATLIAERVVNI